MDPMVDRLVRLLNSWGIGVPPSRPERGSYADPFLRDAEAELDEFLNGENRESQKRWAEFEGTSGRSGAGGSASRDSGFAGAQAGIGGSASDGEITLVRAFQILDLPFLAAWEEVCEAHRALLLAYHPDRQNQDPGTQATATLVTQKVNQAFQLIKTHYGK